MMLESTEALESIAKELHYIGEQLGWLGFWAFCFLLFKNMGCNH